MIHILLDSGTIVLQTETHSVALKVLEDEQVALEKLVAVFRDSHTDYKTDAMSYEHSDNGGSLIFIDREGSELEISTLSLEGVSFEGSAILLKKVLASAGVTYVC